MSLTEPTSAPRRACLYLRSSKDRHDLSLDAQRRALQAYAHDQGVAVVAEYADAVESGKDDDRPGFQALLRALKDHARTWDTILALDTSRIARRRHLAMIFEHEAEKAQVKVIYQSVPDTDPITGMLLRSILQAMDEWHSLTSKAKGLAGMAESVRQGWRAGGQAPRGYRLAHQPTGTLRDGQPVLRSKLAPGPDADAVATYLRARATGKPRGIASQLSGITGDLHGLEWQALTYAGHTVWGMHHEHRPGGYVGGSKRRPRAQWQVTRDTHPPLITDAEAEAILTRLEARAGQRTRTGDRIYLLSGLLQTADGGLFSGETNKGQRAYRMRGGGRISARLIEGAVLDQLFADLAAPDTAAMIARAMRAQSAPAGKPRDLAGLRSRLAQLDRGITNLVRQLGDDPDLAAAIRRTIVGMEQERTAVAEELARAETERQQAAIIAAWTPADVQRLLTTLRDSLAADLSEDRVLAVRESLHALVGKIVLDLESRAWEIHYRLDTGIKLASPRGCRPAPVSWLSRGRAARRGERRQSLASHTPNSA
jgi:DNA invertase Pin-like site-specific DNA recombinase